jgi:hypothetical protein
MSDLLEFRLLKFIVAIAEAANSTRALEALELRDEVVSAARAMDRGEIPVLRVGLLPPRHPEVWKLPRQPQCGADVRPVDRFETGNMTSVVYCIHGI